MSRKIIGKVAVEGTLTALTPISVGGLGEGEHVDLELAEDGTGRCYIPGTSLAGPMRAWLRERLIPIKTDGPDKDFTDKEYPLLQALFGYVAGSEGQASALFIHDSPIKEEHTRRERRHGIAIDERTGTAREKFFYTRALLPMGTSLPLKMELDVFDKDAPTVGALACILEALENGEIRFGAAKTRGMGRMKLDPDPKIYYYDFSNAEALDQWLGRKPSAVCGLDVLKKSFNVPDLKTSPAFKITIHWRAASPIMVKAGRDGMETDMLPLMSGVDGKGKNIAPVIPGSSIKGVLRAQARRILNTLFNPAYDPKYDGEKQQEERWKILSSLFGSKDAAGHLSVCDVYYDANSPVSLENWLDENTAAMNSVTEKQQHVAIDRFTGGASDEALYSARPVKRGGGWGPIVLTLNDATEQELALLKLLVRDLKDGYIPIGFGSRRGLGEIEVKDEDVHYSEGFPEDSELQPAWDEFVASGGTGFGAVRDKGGERT